MYKKTASVLILSTILLAACSKEEPKAALDCAQPATLQNTPYHHRRHPQTTSALLRPQ